MKYDIIIEEVVSSRFCIEASSAFEAFSIIKQKYRDSDVVLEPGDLEYAEAIVLNSDGTAGLKGAL